MARLSLKPKMLNPNSWKQKYPPYESPITFMWPQKGFIKLNFDGAAKGKLGVEGSGGVFKDDKVNTICLFVMDCGTTRNNEAELYALKRGMEIAKRESFQRLEMEGDSNLAIEMVKKIQQGTTWEKISQIWRTTQLVKEIRNLIRRIDYIVPTHVRRLGNMAVDNLSNWGCGQAGKNLDIRGEELSQM